MEENDLLNCSSCSCEQWPKYSTSKCWYIVKGTIQQILIHYIIYIVKANYSPRLNSYYLQEYTLVSNCFITYTVLLIEFFIHAFLASVFGYEYTQSLRNMISLLIHAAIPSFRIYKNDKMQKYAKSLICPSSWLLN